MRLLGFVLATLIVVGAVSAVVFRQEVGRFRYQTSLFTGASQHDNFNRQEDFYPINEMPGSTDPRPFPRGVDFDLPETFSHKNKIRDSRAFLERTDTAALFILHDGKIRFENYWLTGGADVAWLTHSVSKSMVATAVGLALKEGRIKSLDDPITRYVPTLKESGYDGVPIRHILQMSSGIRWTEDYADRASDINLFGVTLLTGGSYDDFVGARVSERSPGGYHHYTGMDTQALTMLVRASTQTSLADFLKEKFWHPLGMQDRAYWTTDRYGVELGLGGLSATARDLAKVGELYRNGGNWFGNQILDPAWVTASTTVTEPHLARGENPASAHRMGYGYHWWLPEGDDQDYSAIGIYNQFIYVNPKFQTVIVKLSAYRDYANGETAEHYLEAETFSLFRAIASQVGQTP